MSKHKEYYILSNYVKGSRFFKARLSVSCDEYMNNLDQGGVVERSSAFEDEASAKEAWEKRQAKKVKALKAKIKALENQSWI